MEEKISPLTAGILQGLNEAIEDAKGFEVEGMKKKLQFIANKKWLSTAKKKFQRIGKR